MNLRRSLSVVPVLFLVMAAACADQENPDGAGTGKGDPTDPTPLPVDPSQPGQPGVAKTLCTMESGGDGGKVIKGTLLLPDTVLEGELFIGKDGKIACVDKSCSSAEGYATAATDTGHRAGGT